MPFIPSLPDDAVLLDLFRQYPELARPVIESHQPLMQGPSPLSVAERELIAAYVSALNSCRYCHGVHRRTAEAFGTDPNLMEALIADIDAAPIDARLRSIIRYVRKLTQDPSRMMQEDAAAVLAAGWPESALVHAVFVTGVFAMMNRLVFGLGIEGDADYYAKAATRLHDQGYTGLLKLLGEPS